MDAVLSLIARSMATSARESGLFKLQRLQPITVARHAMRFTGNRPGR